eukprot:5161005-Pyramimonas_sp.AAC.1
MRKHGGAIQRIGTIAMDCEDAAHLTLCRLLEHRKCMREAFRRFRLHVQHCLPAPRAEDDLGAVALAPLVADWLASERRL